MGEECLRGWLTGENMLCPSRSNEEVELSADKLRRTIHSQLLTDISGLRTLIYLP